MQTKGKSKLKMHLSKEMDIQTCGYFSSKNINVFEHNSILENVIIKLL